MNEQPDVDKLIERAQASSRPHLGTPEVRNNTGTNPRTKNNTGTTIWIILGFVLVVVIFVALLFVRLPSETAKTSAYSRPHWCPEALTCLYPDGPPASLAHGLVGTPNTGPWQFGGAFCTSREDTILAQPVLGNESLLFVHLGGRNISMKPWIIAGPIHEMGEPIPHPSTARAVRVELPNFFTVEERRILGVTNNWVVDKSSTCYAVFIDPRQEADGVQFHLHAVPKKDLQ